MRKKLFTLFGLGGLAAAVIFLRPRFLMRWIERSTSTQALYSINTERKVIALTIDDGPHADITPKILDVLAVYNIPATFFIIGERVHGNETLVRDIVSAGHELGNHLMVDTPSIQLSIDEFERQLLLTDEILQPYAPIQWMRPASGWYNKAILEIVRRHGYQMAIASVYPYDAQISNVPFIVNYVVANAFPGAIIDLHEGTDERWHTVDALEQIIPALQAEGYEFVTLSALAQMDD